MKQDNPLNRAPGIRCAVFPKTGRSLARKTVLRAAAAALPLLFLAGTAGAAETAPDNAAAAAPQTHGSAPAQSAQNAAAAAPAAAPASPASANTAATSSASAARNTGEPPVPLSAASATASSLRLDPVVVVATRTPELLADVSPAVTNLAASELSVIGNYSLADALRAQSGIQTLGDALGNVQSIFIRGLEGRMTLVTLDGRRLNPGFSNFDATILGTDNLASIQIMRGATSTIHGADAAGGVIAFRTTDPFAAVPAGKSSTGSVSAEAGSYGYLRGGLEFATAGQLSENDPRCGKIGVSLGTSWTQADGYRPNSDHRSLNVLPRVDWQLNDKLRLNLVARYNDYESGMPGDIASPSATDRIESQNYLVSPGVFLKVNDRLDLSAYYSFTRNNYKAVDSWGGDQNIADAHEATIQATWRAHETVTLSGGYTYEHRLYDRSGQRYHGGFDSHSPWLQVQATPVKNLHLSAAARYNQFSNYDDALTGEANIHYRIAPTGTTLHARVANAYNVPDIGTLSYDTSFGYGPAAFFRTGDLAPEKNFALEIGVKQNLPILSGGTLGATLFQNNLTDLIQWDWVAHVGYNINKARTRGIELSADLNLNKQFRAYASATFLQAENRSAHGQRLARRPDFTATLGLEHHTADDRLTVGAAVVFVHGLEDNHYDPVSYTSSRVDLRDYVHGRLYANVRLFHGLEVYARLENLFDQRYSAADGYPAPPLTAYAGLRWRW